MRCLPISARLLLIRSAGRWWTRRASASRPCRSKSPQRFPPISASLWGSTVSMATEFKFDRRGLLYAGFASLVGGVLGFSHGRASAAPPWPTGTTLLTAARVDGVDGGAFLGEDGLWR